METRLSDGLAQVSLPARGIIDRLSPQTLQCGPTGPRNQSRFPSSPSDDLQSSALYVGLNHLGAVCLDSNEATEGRGEGRRGWEEE